MIGLRRSGRGAVVDPNLKFELKFNVTNYTDLAATVAANTNDYVRAWRSTVNSHLFTQSTDAARPQRVSDGLYFDGGDSLSIAHNADFNPLTGDFSVAAWIYPTSAAATIKAIMVKSGSGICFYLKSDNKLAFVHDSVAELVVSSAPITINTWSHVAAARVGTSLKIYINGANDGAVTNSTNFNSANALTIGVGGGGTSPFLGKMTDLRYFKAAAEYTANFTPPTRSA